jgi:hypothetical protein
MMEHGDYIYIYICIYLLHYLFIYLLIYRSIYLYNLYSLFMMLELVSKSNNEDIWGHPVIYTYI